MFKTTRKKQSRATLNINVFATGRLGNQLYQAAVANSIAVAASKNGINSQIYWHLTQPYPSDFLREKPFSDYLKKNHSVYIRLFTKRDLKDSPFYLRICYKVWRMFIVSRHEIVPEKYSLSEKFEFTSDSVAIIHPHQQFQFVNAEFVNLIVRASDECCPSQNSNLIQSVFVNASIHLRFGDFLNADVIQEYGQLSEHYYLSAIDIVRQRALDCEVRWWIFTDDQELAADMIRKFGLNNIQFVASLGLSDYHELIHFSRNDFLILSNSTFSWWAGYLADESATIIAPDPLTLKSDSKKAISPKWVLSNAQFGLR
jgi:hypothetical protein